jgi:hypothetical protein
LTYQKVIGNVVDGVPIAAQISVSQFALAGGQGFIDSIDSTTGNIKIVGGPTIRINDPEGVFGPRLVWGDSTTQAAYDMFTSDTENPSVSSFSGYPMCVPRSSNDIQCPASNRAAGAVKQGTL